MLTSTSRLVEDFIHFILKVGKIGHAAPDLISSVCDKSFLDTKLPNLEIRALTEEISYTKIESAGGLPVKKE